jgi:hypothetical protein
MGFGITQDTEKESQEYLFFSTIFYGACGVTCVVSVIFLAMTLVGTFPSSKLFLTIGCVDTVKFLTAGPAGLVGNL